MYKFYNPNKASYPFTSKLQTIVNGINLDEKIAGYKTLAVYGRELAEKKVDYLNDIYVNHDNRYIDSNYVEREITVVYEIQRSTIKEFRETFEELNYYLREPNFQLIFTDDREFFYIATLSSIDLIDKNTLNLQSSFNLIAINPFKKSVDTEILEFTQSGILKKVTHYPIEIEGILVTIKEASSKLILRNVTTGRRIILDKEFKVGEQLVINFKDGTILGKNNLDYMKHLELTSDWEDFEVSYNNELNTNVKADVKIEYREVRLWFIYLTEKKN